MEWNPMDDSPSLARPLWIVWMVLLFLGIAFYALRPRNKKHFEDCAQIPFRAEFGGAAP